MFMFDAMGEYHKYFAVACGKSRQTARTELERLGPKEISVQDSVFGVTKLLLKTHKEET